MASTKNELQNLITGNGQEGGGSLIKRAQIYLGGNEIPGFKSEENQQFKNEEEKRLKEFILKENLIFSNPIPKENFIGEGAEQKVYRFDSQSVIKLNDSVFYEYWRDYFNSLLIHNFFFKSTQYELLGFKLENQKIFAVVKQDFIEATGAVDLSKVKELLEFNGFENIRNNDYRNDDLGIIFEDLHDENVIFQNNLPYFIDTVFYLTENFHKN